MVALPSNNNMNVVFTQMDTVSAETFKSLQVDFYNSLNRTLINSCLEGRNLNQLQQALFLAEV